ncbi:MAG TPA: histidine kinase [Solirubrobacteraceae bacterium]|nr:histidine kinase [Solirubrobacteraceae bacterium]
MLEALAALGAVAAVAVAAWPRARPVAVWAVTGASGFSLATSVVAFLGPGRTSGWLSLLESGALITLVFLALRRAPGRPGAIAAVVAGAATVLIVPAHETTSDSALANAAGMAVWGFAALLAAGAARYLEALDARRARSVAEARRAQRLALARDLHDFVAHDVSAIVVQAQAAQVVGTREPQEALAALQRIEQAGLHALSAMDRAVDALRDAGPPGSPRTGAMSERALPADGHGLPDLRALTSRFEATGRARVTLDVADGIAEGVPAEVGHTAYRLVAEALTNVLRHAPGAARVELAITGARLGDAPAVAVSVSNDAGGSAGALRPQDRTGGFGLAGLRERVEALGGTFDAGPHDGGWQLRAVLPLGTAPDRQ